MKSHQLRKFVLTVISLVLLITLAACAGVGTNGSVTSITGTITSVSSANHSVTLSVAGTSYTVTGLSDQEVQALQAQIGKTYTVQVTQNSDGSYAITVGTNPTPATNETPGINGTPEGNETPEATETPNANINGSISLVAQAQNVSNTSLTVTLPDGTSLTIALTAQTDRSDLNGNTLSNGQKVKIEADGTPGGFTATKIKLADASDDVNTVDFKGSTTQTVGPDHMLHFVVGNHQFSYALSPSADLGDFNNNASSIASNTPVKVKVQFNGSTGTAIKVSNNS